jgi:hypothetical protein
MGKVFIQGVALAIAGFVAIALNQLLNLGLGSIAFGLLIGGILGLVSDGGPVGRVGAFVVGIVVAMVIYIVRVLFLNDSFGGQVLAMLITLGLLTVICALTAGKLPLWAALAGTALVTGAYETAFVAAPQNVTSELHSHTTAALVPAAFGFLAAVLVQDKAPGADRSAKGDNNATSNEASVSLTKEG